MKRCLDCGNVHENETGWCGLCDLPPRFPTRERKEEQCSYDCLFCWDFGIPGGCVRCGRGIIEKEDE